MSWLDEIKEVGRVRIPGIGLVSVGDTVEYDDLDGNRKQGTVTYAHYLRNDSGRYGWAVELDEGEHWLYEDSTIGGRFVRKVLMAGARQNEEYQRFLEIFEVNFVHRDDVDGRRQELENLPPWIKVRIGQKIDQIIQLRAIYNVARQKNKELERTIRELREGEGKDKGKRMRGEAQMAAALAALEFTKGDVHAAYRMLTQ